MPLLSVTSQAIPKDHSRCNGEGDCLQCAANRNLTEEDWAVVEFFAKVQDQSANLTPITAPGALPVISPRLEGWLAVCEIYEIPREDRPDLVSQARVIFEGIHGRIAKSESYSMTPEQLSPDFDLESVA